MDNVLDQFDAFRDDPQVGLISLMDHAPGQRQFQTMDQYIFYYKTKRGLSDEAFCRLRRAPARPVRPQLRPPSCDPQRALRRARHSGGQP